MITRIDHIGIAVKSLQTACAYYENALGLKRLGGEEVPSQGVRTVFFEAGEVNIELLEPMSAESPIAKFIEKKGEGIHHIAFATDDISSQLGKAKSAGVALIHETPVEGAHEKLVAFLHPKSTHGALTELCISKADA